MTTSHSDKHYKATEKVSESIKQYYRESAEAASHGEPVILATGNFPVEFLYAMNVVPWFPENYSALCSARQVAGRYCRIAEENGYSKTLCSYFKCGLGSILEGGGPFGGTLRPKMIVTTRFNCIPHIKWWEILARFYEVPLFVLDGPHVVAEKMEDYHYEYMVSQLEDLIQLIEKTTGKHYDQDRFKETLELANEASRYWRWVLDSRKNIPSPITLSDLATDMFVSVVLLGTQKAVKIYRQLFEEVSEKVKRRQGAIEEKIRLAWDNIVLWYNLGLFNYFEQHDAAVIYEPYISDTWGGVELNINEPLKSLASKCLNIWANFSLEVRAKRYFQVVKDFHIDGVVFHSNRACKPFSMGQIELAKYLRENGIPSVSFEADMADPAAYADGQVKLRLDAFLELLKMKKGLL